LAKNQKVFQKENQEGEYLKIFMCFIAILGIIVLGPITLVCFVLAKVLGFFATIFEHIASFIMSNVIGTS